ncbi:MAG: hypothetical protein L0331_11570, partial [Chloroflexi bacterium]|nr:hypothetical protein [Chloroflexota bacterium]
MSQSSQTPRLSPLLVAAVALGLVALAVGAGWTFFKGDPALLRRAAFDHDRITPNADGNQDITRISYEISRNATVSIYFEDRAGQRYYFRQEERRGVGEYEVLFSGVVHGYRRPEDTIEGDILARLLPDGDYTWTIEAVESNGRREQINGRLAIAEADPELPDLRDFSLDKHTFTPNQDGIDDRVQIQFFLTKEVAQTRVFLLTPEGVELPIQELDRDVPPNDPGWHIYDYEAGVDNKATPPPDGTYPIVAVAEDAEGQRVRVEDSLGIQYGGVPRANILPQAVGEAVTFSATAVPLCGVITFTLTVENYGATPIRTSGPPPGAVYDSDWNYNTIGWPTESGVWRVAIGFENQLSDYPYRWAIGSPAELERIGDHYYLMPGRRAVVTGGIHVVDFFGERNPQPVWAGLIHEDVGIEFFNNR